MSNGVSFGQSQERYGRNLKSKIRRGSRAIRTHYRTLSDTFMTWSKSFAPPNRRRGRRRSLSDHALIARINSPADIARCGLKVAAPCFVMPAKLRKPLHLRCPIHLPLKVNDIRIHLGNGKKFPFLKLFFPRGSDCLMQQFDGVQDF